MGRTVFVITTVLALAIALALPASAGERITIGGADSIVPLAQELAKPEVSRSEGRIVPLSLNGVEPSPESVAKGTYKLVCNFYFVLPARPKPLAQSFVDFTLGAEGDKVIRGYRALPVK